ncbi:hypothetical protein Bbelb_329780 [Branchiostoma belcheri]|nr:hypothetical protein Bbelb_329780 [Branchiostoma belcheri]
MDRKKPFGNPNPSSQPRRMAADGQTLHHAVPPRPWPGLRDQENACTPEGTQSTCYGTCQVQQIASEARRRTVTGGRRDDKIRRKLSHSLLLFLTAGQNIRVWTGTNQVGKCSGTNSGEDFSLLVFGGSRTPFNRVGTNPRMFEAFGWRSRILADYLAEFRPTPNHGCGEFCNIPQKSEVRRGLSWAVTCGAGRCSKTPPRGAVTKRADTVTQAGDEERSGRGEDAGICDSFLKTAELSKIGDKVGFEPGISWFQAEDATATQPHDECVTGLSA